MERLWGEIVPVPEDRLIVLQGGERLDGSAAKGPGSVAYTPGHAQHHVSYLHEPSGTVYAGDVAGVRIGDGPIMPPTPPPDIELDLWRTSLDTLAAWDPRAARDHPLRHLRRPAGAPRAAARGARPARRLGARPRRRRIRAPRARLDHRPRRRGPRRRLLPGHAARRAVPRARPLLGDAGATTGRSLTVLQGPHGRYPEGPMSQVVELPRVQGPGSGLGGSWHVIVRNDDHNTFDGVAGALARTIPGDHARHGLLHRRPHPQHRPRHRVERPPRTRRALLGATARPRARRWRRSSRASALALA